MVLSWAGFTVATLLGAIMLIGTYIYRTHYLVMTARFENALGNKNAPDYQAQLDEAMNVLKTTRFLEASLFVLLVAQPLVFTVSVCYLFAFAVHNI